MNNCITPALHVAVFPYVLLLKVHMLQHRGASYLFFGDTHVVFDIGEDGGMDEQTSVLHRTASALQRRPLLLPTVHQLQDLIKLMLVDLTQQQKHINSLHTRRETTQKLK